MSVITIFKKLYHKETILEEDIESAIQYCPSDKMDSIREKLKEKIESIKTKKEKSDEDHKKDEERIKALLKKYQFPEKDFNFKDCAILIEYLKLEDIINDFGDLAEEAILLISLFGNLEQSIQYLINHEKAHPGMKLDLYDALHFEHPKTSDWDPSIWRSLALKNMPGKLFTKVFPHADKIEKYLKDDLALYQQDKDKSTIRAEILKNLTVAKTKEIESEKIFTSLDEFLDFKIKKFKSKSAPEEPSTVVTLQEKEKKTKKEKVKPIQLKSALELKVEKQMEYWAKGKLGIDTRKKPTEDEMKKMDEFQKSEEFKSQREIIEVQELNKFEESVMNEYINLQSQDIKKQIETKIQEDLFAVVDSEGAKKILEFTTSIEILENQVGELEKIIKDASATEPIAPDEKLQKETALKKLKSERTKIKKERDEIKKGILNKIKSFENTEKGFAKKRDIIRSAILELLPPNKVLADHVTARLEKEKSNLLNATEMQMAKIYSIPDKKSKKESEQETAPSPTISPSIELATLYEIGKKCAYTDKEKNPRAALWFYEQGISEDGYDRYVTWEPEDDKESMPDIFIDLADIGYTGYYLKRLDKEDPRIATAGRETSCCQHVDGAGKSCAKHAVTDPNGALYAIFERSEHSVGHNISPEDVMVAQSWAWRGKKDTHYVHHERDFVFDSVESHLNFRVKNQPLLSDAFTYVGHKLVSERNDIGRVIVGKDRYANTPKRIGVLDLEKSELATPDQYNTAHRDSKKNQGIIASRHFPYISLYLNQHSDIPKEFNELIRNTTSGQIEIKSEKIFTQLLFQAIEKDDIKLLNDIINLPRDELIKLSDCRNNFRENIFSFLARKRSSIDMFRLLLKHIDINETNSRGETALHILTYNFSVNKNLDKPDQKEDTYYLEIIKLLLENGADPLAKDKSGNSAMSIAIKYQHFLTVELFLNNKNLDLTVLESNVLTTLLISAIIAKKDHSMIQRILDSVDPNQPDAKGKYPLEIAILEKNTDAIQLLLKNKADIIISRKTQILSNPIDRAFRTSESIAELFLPFLPKPLPYELSYQLFSHSLTILKSPTMINKIIELTQSPLEVNELATFLKTLIQHYDLRSLKENGIFDAMLKKLPENLVPQAIGPLMVFYLNFPGRIHNVEEMVRFLLSYKPVFTEIEDDPNAILRASIDKHELRILKILLTQYHDEKIQREKIEAALTIALQKNKPEHLRYLLGLIPGLNSDKHIHLFEQAIAENNAQILTLLIESVKEKEEKRIILEKCLSLIGKEIFWKRNKQFIELLDIVLKNGADPFQAMDPEKPRTSVFVALGSDNIDYVYKLVQYMDIRNDAIKEKLEQNLVEAIKNNRKSMIEGLLGIGILIPGNKNEQDALMNEAFKIAMSNKSINLLKLLLAQEGAVNTILTTTNRKGIIVKDTLLSYAIKMGHEEHKKMIPILLEHGITISPTDNRSLLNLTSDNLTQRMLLKAAGDKYSHEFAGSLENYYINSIKLGREDTLLAFIRLGYPLNLNFYQILSEIFTYDQKKFFEILKKSFELDKIVFSTEIKRALFDKAFTLDSLWALTVLLDELKIDPFSFYQPSFKDLFWKHLEKRKKSTEITDFIMKRFPEIGYEFYMMYVEHVSNKDENEAIFGIQQLIHAGLDPKDISKYPEDPFNQEVTQNPLRMAIHYRNIKLALFLLEAGVPPEQQMLIDAIKLRSLPLVKALLTYPFEPKFNPNQKFENLYGNQLISPLYQAISNGDTEIAIALLEAHADPNFAKEAIDVKPEPFITTLLVSNPEDEPPAFDPAFSISREEYGQPLDFGQSSFQPEVFDDGLSLPEMPIPDPNLVEAEGDTLVMLSIRKNDKTIFEALIKANADLSKTNANGQTALMIAKALNREEMISIIEKVQSSPEFMPMRELHRRKSLPSQDSSSSTTHKPKSS